MVKYLVMASMVLACGTSFAAKESAVYGETRKPSAIDDIELATGTKISAQNNELVFVYEKSEKRTLVAYKSGKKMGTYSRVTREMGGGCYIRMKSDSITEFTIVNVLPGATFSVLKESTIYQDSEAVGLALDQSTSVTINGQPLDPKVKLEFAMICLSPGAGASIKITPAVVKSVFDTALIVTPANYNLISIEPK